MNGSVIGGKSSDLISQHCTVSNIGLAKYGVPTGITHGGSYVHIGSAGLLRFPPRDVLSVAPKGAIQQLIKGVAREEGVNGIRANSIAIGVIETGLFMRLKQTAFDQAWHDAVLQTLALKRYGQPEEVADLAVFLASSRAAYVTGQMVAQDGGWSL